MSEPRVLVRPGQRIRRPASSLARLDYPATVVGSAGNVTVAYDSSLGSPGLSIAQNLLNAAMGPYDDMQSIFGISGGAIEVVIAPLSGANDGSGGAYHDGCDFTSGGTLYLDACFANTSLKNPLDLQIALYVAELSECFMGPQNRGWNCGYSNGEGLSRFCAEIETPPGTLDAYATGPAWAQAGYPDWIGKTEQTDGNAVSTGCAIVYLYWMRSRGFSAANIAAAGGATLAENYQTLTGKTTAYQDLTAALQGISVNSDDPFSSS